MPIWRDRLFVSSGLRVLSPRWTIKGDRSNTAIGWDATVFADGLLPHLTLSATVRNLLDRRNGDPVSAEHLQSTVAEDGITFWLSAGYAF
jgi:outer membrane receptor protein involved in Fe transport